MVNMKLDPKEAKEYAEGCAPSSPAYPYGLCLTLNDESLGRLGVKTLPPVGTKMRLSAVVDVVRASTNQTQASGTESSLELQVTDMELSGGEGAHAAQTLFSKEQ